MRKSTRYIDPNRFIPQFKVYVNPNTHNELKKVFKSGYIGQGPKVEEFERLLKRYLDFDYGVTVNSGTSALWLALHLIGVGPGDTVISTPMTCSATNQVITNIGADILWADVDKYGNLSPETVEEAINHYAPSLRGNIKAIMAVDWGGLPCDYDGIRAVAPGLQIIEDAAHAFMATYKGKSVARSGGDYVAYSFQAIKHLTAGDGGLLVTPESQYERAKLLRWYGLDRTSSDAMRCYFDIAENGFKFHMNDINATIGLCNLPYAIDMVDDHREAAEIYDYIFINEGFLPEWPDDRKSSFWLYTLHVNEPRRFASWMKERGIGVSQTHNRNDKYTSFSKYQRELPNLDRFFETMTCIPVGWWLQIEDINFIIENVLEWTRKNGEVEFR